MEANFWSSSFGMYIIGSVIFLALYFFVIMRKVFKKATLSRKIFLTTIPFTLIFVVFIGIFFTISVNGMYATLFSANMGAINGILNNASADYNPATVQGQISNLMNNGSVANVNPFTFSNGFLWFILAILVYMVILFLIYAIMLKPLKRVGQMAEMLVNNENIKDISVVGKDFVEIKTNLVKVREGILKQRGDMARIKGDYAKIVPTQAIQLLGKKNVSELDYGDSAQKFCFILNISIKYINESMEEQLIKCNKIYGVVSPIIRKFNGVIFNYAQYETQCIFLSKASCLNAKNEIELMPNDLLNMCDINTIDTSILLCTVGYSKQYSLQLFYKHEEIINKI